MTSSKRWLKSLAVAVMSVIICFDAVAQAETTPGVASSAGAGGGANWKTLVESLSEHPDLLKKDWSEIRAVLPAGCFRNAGRRVLSCPPMDGVVRISVDPGPLGLIDVVLKEPANCEKIYDVVRKHFGSGVSQIGEKCHADWNIDKWVERAGVRLSSGRRDPNLLYLQFGIEQGP